MPTYLIKLPKTSFFNNVCWASFFLVTSLSSCISSANDALTQFDNTEPRLVLPKSYQAWAEAFHRAAELTADSPRCHRLLAGDLHQDLSTQTQAVFRMLCRGPAGRTFALLVSGDNLMVLDETRAGTWVTFEALRDEYEAEQEKLRLQEEAAQAALLAEKEKEEALEQARQKQEAERIEAERRRDLWARCWENLSVKIRNMQALTFLTRDMPEPALDSEQRVVFYIDFDAEDLYRQPLYYRAECKDSDETRVHLLIRPRRSYFQDILPPPQ